MNLLTTVVEAVDPPAGLALKLLGGLKSVGNWLLVHPGVFVAVAATGVAGLEHHRATVANRDVVQLTATLKTATAAMKAASDLAVKNKATATAVVAQFAKVKDDAYQVGVADGRSALHDWYAGQLRATAPASGVRAAPAQNLASGVPVQPAAAASVGFSEAQLKGWSDDYEYATTCRSWALGIAKLYDGVHWPEEASAAALAASK